ncbi:large ribosomal subunit protein eL21-like [Symsagittifera roscoffensis]|uniref:large ribosomal subunit protein eL21-like n=1 Tax=Symsagittifera roscoffensis TaxID=84072 RepID=UPI00307B493E
MTNAHGKRRGTRYMFSREYKKNGVIPMKTYMLCYKKGDLVDIKGCGAQQKGMPYKAYHGRTGRVYNVTRAGLGVIVNKRVKGRIIAKRINVRVEHVKPSKSRLDFLNRVKQNEIKRKEAKAAGKRVSLKRQPKPPKGAFEVPYKKEELITLEPIPYEFVF